MIRTGIILLNNWVISSIGENLVQGKIAKNGQLELVED